MKRVPALLIFSMMAGAVLATAQDHWLHVKVDDTSNKGELVRVNVPLSLAEKVLPAIKHGDLRDGKIRIHGDFNGVDLQALMDAVRSSQDGEFVSVQEPDSNVRVAKKDGFLLVKVREKDHDGSQVDVKVPLVVANALLSSGKDELDIGAAIRALGAFGNTELVTVHDHSQTVHIWVDSQNASE
jgi:hypothetical protein